MRTGVALSLMMLYSASALRVCPAGFFLNEAHQCEPCPIATHSPVVGATSIDTCVPCPYKTFQPAKGKAMCAPLFVKLHDVLEINALVVGLFVEGDTSCAYVSRSATKTTDKLCWGALTTHNPTVTRGVLPEIISVCGDGVLHPTAEQCDDGNPFNGDGCSDTCRVEAGFFCEARTTKASVVQSLVQNSRCCRVTQGPPSHTPTCARCGDRPSPYPGVRFRTRDCSVVDVDECAEGTDGCVGQPGGVACVNSDAAANHGSERFRCDCPPGKFLLGGVCTTDQFSTKVVLDVGPGESVDLARVEVHARAEADDATETANVLLQVRVTRVGPGQVHCTMFVGSWAAMQRLTTLFDPARLVQRVLGTFTA
jgi:cysteine-rich repeat protein